MAPDSWNRTNIPRPAIQCQLAVPLRDSTEKCIQNLTDQCSAVYSFLKNQALNAEVATLDSILYAYHHRLSCHKPYLALKQVQQCTRRIKAMDLEGSLKDMMDLLPKKAEVESAENSENCTLPSQPILELVSMKVLGCCKLLLRLMDCCCKAFHLCLQHLSLDEYIVLNVVLLGLSSRLWVMHRGLLKRLIAFYGLHISLQKIVSDFQKMPYFKDFVFPTNIEEHIGSLINDLNTNKLQMRFPKKDKAHLLNQIFDSSNLVNIEKLSEIRDVDVKAMKETIVDVGRPIKMQRFNRGELDTFDVKALLLPVKASRLQSLGTKNKPKESKNRPALSQQSNKKQCVGHLVPKIQEAADFRALSEQLHYAVKWCKARKLKTEAVFFRNRYVRCNRLQHAEALGYSLKKKLQCWKKSMCRCLREQTLRKDRPKRCLRMQRIQEAWKHVVSLSHRHQRVKRKGFKRSPLHSDVFPDEQKPSSQMSRPPRSELREPSTIGADQRLTNTDDIDNIFSSIGI